MPKNVNRVTRASERETINPCHLTLVTRAKIATRLKPRMRPTSGTPPVGAKPSYDAPPLQRAQMPSINLRRAPRRHSYRLVTSLASSAFCTALALIPLSSQAGLYPVKIKKDLGDLNIYVETSSVDISSSSRINLTLANMDDTVVFCRASFDPKIEQKKSFKRKIDVGDTTVINYQPSRQLNRLLISIKCRAPKPATSSEN